MSFIKKNYGWLLVTILATLPLLPLSNMLETAITTGFSSKEGEEAVNMLYHISGEFAIRWLTAVLTCTPFFIIFGINNLFVRQAMGIAAAIWSILHFVIFIAAAGFLETFTQYNYIAGLIGVLILIPLLFTSNRKSMKRLKTNWKKLQSFSYAAIFLSLVHVAILDKTWVIYAVIVGVGFMIRIPMIKNMFLDLRKRRKTA